VACRAVPPALIDHDETAIGLFTHPGQLVPVRGFLRTEPPTTVVAATDLAVCAGPAGLVLRDDGDTNACGRVLTGWYE